MAKPLRLFIEQPLNQWQVEKAYGREGTEEFREFAIMSMNGSGRILAPVGGRLSTRPPAELRPDRNRPYTPIPSTAPLFQITSVYLELSFGAVLGRSNPFRDKVLADFPGLSFRFILETASLQTALAAALQNAVIPAGPNPPTADEIFRAFLGGVFDVSVTAGAEIGRGVLGDNNRRLASLGVHNQDGSIDPSFFYERMRDFVEDGQEAVDTFTGIMPSSWPILPASKQAVLVETTGALFPYSVLVEAKNRVALTRDEWRTVGDNQKALYRRRLLRRVGHAPPGATDPPFAFNDVDWRNLFQLEAVVEFFMNFREPWEPGSVPQDPDTNPSIDEDTHRRDFLDLAGADATAAGTVVTIGDGGINLARVRAHARNGDVIELDTDTARDSHTYRIVNKNVVHNTVTLDAAPALAPSPSPWRIKARPQIVVIDSFGPRHSGTGAVVTGIGPGGFSNVQLGRAVARVNRFFDTIYFPSDQASPRRTYRILRVQNDTVLVEGNPSFGGPADTSEWHIQAGLGGSLDAAFEGAGPLAYNLGPGGARGFDHFDGMLFVIYGEQVRQRARWNSYTSRGNFQHRQYQSTIDGNRGYDLVTYFSQLSSTRNYCVKVVDYGQVDTIVPATPGHPAHSYDTCSEARFFFDPHFFYPNANAFVLDDVDGKTEIRMHYSHDHPANHGCDSAGCLVSPVMAAYRQVLVELIQLEHAATHNGQIDQRVQRLNHRDQAFIEAHVWPGNQANTWPDALVGKLWLVRPDQLPVDYRPPAGVG